MNARQIIEKFGGQTALAHAVGKGQSTVSYWAKTGVIPARWQPRLLDLARERSIDLEASDFVEATKSSASGAEANKNNAIVARMPSKAITPVTQGSLSLGIEKQIEIDGIGMGVLSDGTAFLTGRGLARLTGLASSAIVDLGNEFHAPDQFPRVKRIREILESHGASIDKPYIEIKQRSNTFYAFPDAVCLAVLEYYAFDAGSNIKAESIKNYRLLAGKALRDFIYTQVGYDPNNAVPALWRQFHDRVSLTYNSVPPGYFGVFKEIADMIVTLGQAGLAIDSKFVPDISVGRSWSEHWQEKNLAATNGERKKYEHNYPTYFPQSASNPQEPWCYPESSLGEFRRWFRETYVGEGKFKKYIDGKVKENQLSVSFAQLAIAAYVRE